MKMRLKKKVRAILITILTVIYLILLATSYVGATNTEIIFKDIAIFYTMAYLVLITVVEYVKIEK